MTEIRAWHRIPAFALAAAVACGVGGFERTRLQSRGRGAAARCARNQGTGCQTRRR